MIKLVASDLDGTLLLNVCKYEAHVCTGGG